MSDSLKDRLSSHSNSFEGLLSLIPARYYYDDESSSQWKKGTVSAEEKKAAAHKARMNKFDPDVGSSALDEIKRREHLAANEASSTPVEEEQNVTIYDDRGNVIGGEQSESINELLRSKANNPESNSSTSNVQPSGQPNGQSQKKKNAKKQGKASSDKEASNTEKPAAQPEQAESNESSADSKKHEESPENSESSIKTQRQPKEGIEELRARLAARVNELKAKRKAPGSDAKGAYKTREELLSARKAKLELRKKQAQAHRSENGKAENENDMDDDIDDGDIMIDDEPSKQEKDDSKLMFGQVQFGDGAKLGKDISSLEEERKHKKRNATDQLRVLEQRKAKINKLDKSKQDEIAENAKWSRAILQSEGARVRDDESLLKKTIRQKENRKKRSEKEWKQRIYNVKKGISDREAKRHANISAHKEAKKLRLKGKKRRQHMKAATK